MAVRPAEARAAIEDVLHRVQYVLNGECERLIPLTGEVAIAQATSSLGE